ncbi:19951_t:CDS:1, partial [Gigaspora rosea]
KKNNSKESCDDMMSEDLNSLKDITNMISSFSKEDTTENNNTTIEKSKSVDTEVTEKAAKDNFFNDSIEFFDIEEATD